MDPDTILIHSYFWLGELRTRLVLTLCSDANAAAAAPSKACEVVRSAWLRLIKWRKNDCKSGLRIIRRRTSTSNWDFN